MHLVKRNIPIDSINYERIALIQQDFDTSIASLRSRLPSFVIMRN